MTALGERPILVTGGAGFIGSNLADRLAGEGNDVIVYDALMRPGVERNLAWLKSRHGDRIQSIIADIRDAALLADAANGARAVFHMAAQVAVTTSLADPREDFDINIGGTFNLLEAVRRSGTPIPVIFASTNKVYGDLADIAFTATPQGYLPGDEDTRAHGIGEDRPLDFHTPYGCSKGAADQYVLDYARSFGVPAAVLRMSCIYGERQMGTEDQGWVAHFLIRALEGQQITLYGDGHQVRDILEVGNAVDAYLGAWRRIEQISGRALNLGGGPGNAVSLRTLIDHIGQLVGRAPDVRFEDWRAGDQRYFVADTRAARQALGLADPMPWQTGVARLAEWLATERGIAIDAAARPAPLVRAAAGVSREGLRVLSTTDAVGGVWQYTLDLARGLSAHGVETLLAILGPVPDAAQRAEAEAIAGVTLVETGLPLDWLSDGPAPVLAAGHAIAELARDSHADILQLNMPTLGAAISPPMPMVAVTHGCIGTWWQAANAGEALSPDYRWHRDLMARGLRAADRLVAPTASYARQVARYYELPAPPQVIHNGRTPLVQAAPGAMQDSVLTAGRLWDRVKRATLLDRVAARLPVPFYAAGALTGPHGEHVVLEHLHALGQLDGSALGARLADRPVFVSAASFEPFGLAVLEAASAGCALVLSDIDSFRELWDGAALFVPGEDEAAYGAAIQSLIGDATLRLRLGAAARERAARYTPLAMAHGMHAIYVEALGGRMIKGKVAA